MIGELIDMDGYSSDIALLEKGHVALFMLIMMCPLAPVPIVGDAIGMDPV